MAIKGTSFSVTAAILFNPPTMTSAPMITRTMPVAVAGMEKAEVMFAAIELT